MRNTNKHRKFSEIKLSKSMAIPKVVIDTGHSQVSNVEIFRKIKTLLQGEVLLNLLLFLIQ